MLASDRGGNQAVSSTAWNSLSHYLWNLILNVHAFKSTLNVLWWNS